MAEEDSLDIEFLARARMAISGSTSRVSQPTGAIIAESFRGAANEDAERAREWAADLADDFLRNFSDLVLVRRFHAEETEEPQESTNPNVTKRPVRCKRLPGTV